MCYQLSLLFGVAEGKRDLGFDVGCSSLPGCQIVQQVDQYVVVLQQRYATVPVVEGHVGLNGADVGVDLTRVTLHLRLHRGQTPCLKQQNISVQFDTRSEARIISELSSKNVE